MNNFSPNMLKTFEECPKKYYLKYIEKISIPQKASFFEKGKKIHALAHYYLRGDDISKLEFALSTEEKQLWESLKSNEYFQKKYVNSEYNLSCRIDDFWIGGRLDAVVEDVCHSEPSCHPEHRIDLRVSGSLNYYILDYKTGSTPKNPETDFQTIVYLLALDSYIKKYSELSGKPYSITFIYIDLKNNQNHIIEFNDSLKIQYIKAITDICTQINTVKDFDKITKKCDYCEFNKICN